MTAEFLKKITARTVGCEAKPGVSFVIYGKLRRSSVAQSNYGDYVRFGGDFEAVNEQTGQVFRSSVFLSPGIMEDVLHSAVQGAQEQDKQASAEFAVRFKTVKDAEAARGYIWKGEFLTKPSADDPLTRLRASLEGKVKSLPAPEEPEGDKDK